MSLKPIPVHELALKDPAVFGLYAKTQTQEFAQRAFSVAEVLALKLDPDKGGAHLIYQQGCDGQSATLARISEAVGAPEASTQSVTLPPLNHPKAEILARYPGGIAGIALDETTEGLVILTSTLFTADGERLGPWLSRQMQSGAGIRGVALNEEDGTLEIAFNPRWLDAATLLRTVFQRLPSAQALVVSPQTPTDAVPMRASGASVGLSTVGELMLPVATPLAAGMLVATNYGVVKEAANQLGRGKVGVPLFHTALLACSLVTGQVLAFALTDLSLRYWQRRWRRQLANETEKTIDRALPVNGPMLRVGTGSALEPIALSDLVTGDVIRLSEGDWLPFDGHIVRGQALLDERLALGEAKPVRRGPEYPVWSGSGVIAGTIDVKVEATGANTRLSRMGLRISESTGLIASTPILQEKAVALGDKTALPTLATAGVGWMAGSLITVGAILHQDWVSGPYLAVPLVTLQHIRIALSHGALIQAPAAIPKMALCRFLILDGDDLALAREGLELISFETPSQNPDALLRLIAGVGLYLGDPRGQALVEACAARGLVVRAPEQVTLEDNTLIARISDHRLELVSDPEEGVKRLVVRVDGNEVARLSFKESGVPQVKDGLQRIKSLGVDLFLMSSQPEKDTQALAGRLGVELYGGDLDDAGKQRFLEGLRSRGVKAGFAGVLAHCPGWMDLIDLPIAVEAFGEAPHAADIVLAGEGYPALADLFELAHGFESAVVKKTRAALVPNLLCVAGAFGGVLNGITSGIIANVAVLNVDRSLRKSLKQAPSEANAHPLLKHRQGTAL